MQTRSKQECYEAITKASYQGTKRNFDFSMYVAIHQQAYQDMVRLGEPVPENKKVWDFLQGITDTQCANIKLNVLSNPVFMNNFSQAVNYMASAIDMVMRNASSSARQIANMNRNENGNHHSQNQARGRGRGHCRGSNQGRGRGRGRFGRGQGRGQGSVVTSWSNGSNNGRTQTRGYSHQEWQKPQPLSKESNISRM
jgi:hypothetical protein